MIGAPGEMHGCVDPLQALAHDRARIEAPPGEVDSDFAVRRWAAHDGVDLVPALAKRLDEGRADETARTGDEDPQNEALRVLRW